MKKQESKKKSWAKPEVHVLDIKKVTLGGTLPGNERNDTSTYGPPGLS